MMAQQHFSPRNRFECIFDVCAAIFCTYLFCQLTELLVEWGKWYSPQLHYRLQVQSFMRGSLVIEPDLIFAKHDWAVGRSGMYQLWGLGIPLLLWPAEIIARTFGFRGFPEHLLYASIYLLTSFLLLRVFRHTIAPEACGLSWWVIGKVQQLMLVGIIMLSPSLIRLVAVKFRVYEQAVFFSCLWSLLLFVVLFFFYEKPTRGKLYLMAFGAGFAPFFRLTAVFYGAVTLLIALLLAHRMQIRKRHLVGAICLFLTGPLILLCLNAIRFGDPLEFGYSLNYSGVIANDYALRFGYPFQNESFFSAVRELVGSLFSVKNLNGFRWYAENLHPWQSATLRFREFYFIPFDWIVLVLILSFWAIVFGSFLCSRKKAFWPPLKGNVWAVLAAPWSFLISSALFCFYLYSPSITSRYMMDFFPAFSVAISGLLVWCFHSVARVSATRPLFLATAVSTLLAFVAVWFFHSPIRHDDVGVRTFHAKVLERRLEKFQGLPRSAHSPHVPERYSCRDEEEDFSMLYNKRGWNWPKNCFVRAFTLLFLKPSPCLRLLVGHRKRNVTRLKLFEELAHVRVRVNRDELERVEQEISGRNVSLKYCRSDSSPATIINTDMVSIAWVPKEELGLGMTDFKLLEVEVANRDS